MNATELDRRLFYKNPWQTEADAVVIAIACKKDRPSSQAQVLLDRTIFYPEGGGQASDLGFIGETHVVDVQEIDGEIWHCVELPSESDDAEGWLAQKGIRPQATVHLRIDWPRRLYHMQQHTGQHLLSAVLEEDYGIHTLSFHLGTEYCTIDVAAKTPSELPIAEVEDKVDAWIERDVPLRVHYCPPEELSSFRLRKRPPADESVVRIVEVDGYDWSPCGGTHLDRTGQIRTLKILSLERYKGNVRVYFASGAHALDLLFHGYEELKSVALLFDAASGDVPARVSDSLEKCAVLERKVKQYVQMAAEAEVRLAVESNLRLAAGRDGPRSVLEFQLEGENAEWGTALTKAAVALGRAAIVFSTQDATVIIQAVPKPNVTPLAGLLKGKMAELKGKGGGGAIFFRAGFPSSSQAELFAEYAKSVLEGLESVGKP